MPVVEHFDYLLKSQIFIFFDLYIRKEHKHIFQNEIKQKVLY